MCRLAGSFEDAIQILCRRSEALLVVGLAAKAGDDDVVGGRAGRKCAENNDCEEQGATGENTRVLRSMPQGLKPSVIWFGFWHD